MLEYMEKVIKPYVGTRQTETLLMLDQHGSHSTRAVNEKLTHTNVRPLYIPGGFTSSLQPLDVSINKPLKDAFQKEWNTWMTQTRPLFLASGNRQKPSYQDAVDMPSRSLDTLSRERMVQKSFQTSGLVNCRLLPPADLFDSFNTRLQNPKPR